MGKGGEGEEGKEYIEKPQIQKALATCLLLFSRSVISDSFVTPWTVAHQASVSVQFPRREYWSGLPFPSPGIFLTQGSNVDLLHWQADSYHWATHRWNPQHLIPKEKDRDRGGSKV